MCNWLVINLDSGLWLAIFSSRACVQCSSTQITNSMTVVRPAFGASRTSSYTRALVLASMRILYDAVGLVAGLPVALQTKPNTLYQHFLLCCFYPTPRLYVALCRMTCYNSAVVCSHAIILCSTSLQKQQVQDPMLFRKITCRLYTPRSAQFTVANEPASALTCS